MGIDMQNAAKVQDDHDRWRNKAVAFRMSPEEAVKPDRFARISGRLMVQTFSVKVSRKILYQKNLRT